MVAVTLELWAHPATDAERSCCSPQAVLGARALAHGMGVPHVTLDLRERFRAAVVDRFVEGYARGETPNPCVRCNGEVRFDAMVALADSLGAARLATGHYARIARDADGPLLREGADPRKDQSYMLARLEPALLDRLSFPLGGLDQGRGARAGPGCRAAGGGPAGEPGPVLRGRARAAAASCAATRPGGCGSPAGSWIAPGASSGATTVSTSSPSGSAAVSAWPRRSPSTCSRRTPPRPPWWWARARRWP